jgi:WD40 repeat protein
MIHHLGIEVGQQIGNYHVLQPLGRGGFADVYQAEHRELNKLVAIKILYASLSENEAQHFRKEAQLIASLNHAHIIRVLDFGVENQTPYMVMDYAPGGSLRQLYPRGARMPLDLIVNYVEQAADALQFAHNHHLTHCDVKPENLLLGEAQELLLCDFGLAVTTKSTYYRDSKQTQEEVIAGTIPYMAPEQMKGAPIPASDQYALGVVVYEWLSGTVPFHGTFSQILAQLSMASPPLLREKVPNLPPAIERVVFTALAKSPQQRYPSVQTFANALKEAYQENRVMHPNAVPPRPSRRQVLVFLGGLGVGAAGGSFGTLTLQHLLKQPTIVDHHPSSHSPTVPSSPKPLLRPQLLFTYKGHTDEVASVQWSPDGKHIASGSRDRTVQAWNTDNGNRLYTYTGHKNWIFGVVWSPTGQRIASASADNTVQVYNAATGGQALTYKGHTASVMTLAWSQNNIASGSLDQTVQVWDATGGVLLFTYKGHSAEVDAVAYSSDGKQIASGGVDQTVQVWNAADGTQVFIYKGHTAAIDAVAYSPDGKQIASGGVDQTVQVWNAADGNRTISYQGHTDRVRSIAWSPDGTLIASASADHSVQVWDTKTGARLFVYRHDNWVHSVAWSHDGIFLASASADKTVQVWRMRV